MNFFFNAPVIVGKVTNVNVEAGGTNIIIEDCNNYERRTKEYYNEEKSQDAEPTDDEEYQVLDLEPTEVSDKDDRIKELVNYLCQLYCVSSKKYASSFHQHISVMVANVEIQEWLLDTSRCEYKPFNKNRAFKFARMLCNRKVINLDNDHSLNAILESTDEDTSFRKKMSQKTKKDIKIEGILAKILNFRS